MVVESSFGNTRAVAEAVAGALQDAAGTPIPVLDPETAPAVVPPEVDLLIVGAPTHAFSLPTPASRAQATAKGAPTPAAVGVREWVSGLSAATDLRIVTFDTSVKLRISPGCAAKAARRLLRRRGFTAVERGPSFRVTGTAGPLAPGEVQRATAWGRQLRVQAEVP